MMLFFPPRFFVFLFMRGRGGGLCGVAFIDVEQVQSYGTLQWHFIFSLQIVYLFTFVMR